MGATHNHPYKAFGQAIKSLREKAHETIDEVAGSVEVSKDELARIEKGEIRPSEDVLVLLVNHFNTAERETARLWEQAGYSKEKEKDEADTSLNDSQSTLIISQIDNRVVYTDVVNITANNYGVVMNFLQNAGPNGQPIAVARVGMSHEHAKSILELLKTTLAQTERLNAQPKRLAPGDKKA